MDPVGDSAGAGEVSMLAGAVLGMARLGAVITARATGADIMVGIMDIITIIIMHHLIGIVLKDVPVVIVMLLEEVLHVDQVCQEHQIVRHRIGRLIAQPL